MSDDSMGFGFVLPKGLVDEEGTVHREGAIRLATGNDEIIGDRHPNLSEYPDYRPLVMLSRTIVELGTLPLVTPEALENLFLIDLDYLLDLYNSINPGEAELGMSGEQPATPYPSCIGR
ncbi:hypothetical protein PJF56_20355 [Roseofilum sp. BLCC_M91]|uniref:Phage tail assembly protein n=1 Tax=Roseofilum halophilum BLCC-M91 TaxID=3022259 RepID=A0ABT7BPU6_9CYAN|nr:hypothetical protein [Roseofilum halophilum]MDJ1181218.1 hypothetical protein [Roseofilum halophilum BLCC-M91]